MMIRNDWLFIRVITVLSTILILIILFSGCGNGESDQAVNLAPPSNNTTPIQENDVETSRVYLSWIEHPEHVDGYRIYRGTSIDNVMHVRDVIVAGTMFDELPGTICYRLTAFNADGESSLSAGVCAKI